MKIETIVLTDIEWVGDIAYGVDKYAYLVKTNDEKPICMFDYYWQAEKFIKDEEAGD